MQTIKSYFAFLPIAIPIILGQMVVFVFSIPSSDTGVLWQAWYFVCTGLTTLFLCQWVNCLTFGKSWAATLINVLLLISYGLLISSQLITGESLDYKLAIENLANFKYMETIEMAIEVDWRFPVQLISVLVLLIYANIYFNVFSKTIRNKRWSKFGVGLLGYALMVTATPQQDELTLFARSYAYHAFGGQYKNFEMDQDLPKYPYMGVNEAHHAGIGKPHVLMVMMESANSSFIEKKTEDGTEITPFFNSLIKKGLYVENFYSNGNFTTQGQFSIFSGLTPSFKQNLLLDQPDLKFLGLPAVLKKHGYETIFMHGYHDLDFGGGKPFLYRAGFDQVLQMDEEFMRPEDESFVWGWGLQDDKLFEKFFEYLDTRQMVNDAGTPFFASIGTMSHHHDFKSYPKTGNYPYSFAQTGEEHFANSMYLADSYLRTFFEELDKRGYLKNSLVILVGDHGFPPQGMDIAINGGFIYSGFSESLFRTPFLILHDSINPKREQRAFSHLDIAPTVLDLLGIHELVNFQGKSMMDTSGQHLFHAIQSFDGGYISSIIYPYKYVFHEETGEEYVFHLGQDPQEETNLIDEISRTNSAMYDRLKAGLNEAYKHQKLLDEDRIWPY